VIDLHTHTTASDGRLSPDALVARAQGAGVSVLSVTDHDTVAAAAAVDSACRTHGMEFVPGIEMTAILEETDIHILGYFIDCGSEGLRAFLSAQRTLRIDRVRQIVERLSAFGIVLDAEAILAPALANPQHSVGRPWVARALVAAGHAVDTNDAFARWLVRGCAAFVPRAGAPPAEVIAQIHDASGLASLAHPALIGRDEWIDGFAASGLDAIEVYHSKHDAIATARYRATAARLGLAVSGGSDFHADDAAHGPASPGSVSLPRECFDDLVDRSQRRRRAASRATASGADTSS
jgi:predicted metal-dependent phosphoesterase TrpH